MSSLVRYSPGREFIQTRRAIDQLFDNLAFPLWWDPFTLRTPMIGARPWPFGGLGEVFPGDNLAVDLYEEDDHLVVKAALPGVQPEDIEVLEQNGFLTIRAKNEAHEEWQEFGRRVRQQRYGVWQRSLRLPLKVDVNRTEAELKDGVLTVTLPKLEPHKKLINRIKVNLPKIKLPGFLKKEGKIRISHN